MADLSGGDAQTLLDGIDAAFEAILHGRFGGGIEVALMQASGSDTPSILRTARAGSQAMLCVALGQGAGGNKAPDGIPIGTARLSGGAVENLTVQTEIFQDVDPNESGDATALHSGVLLQISPARLPNGGLIVVRSTEAMQQTGALALSDQHSWRPNGRRHGASGGLGAAGHGQRQSSPASLLLPVTAALLERLGSAAARLPGGFSQMAVILAPGDGSG